MSHLNILTFKYNLAKLRSKAGRPTGRLLSARGRQSSDLMKIYKPDDDEMKKMFNKIAGEPGRISRNDLQALLQRFGKADAAGEAKRMVCVVDYKKDGHIDFEEFMEVHRSGVQLGDIRRAFFVFDKDGDGRISAEEVMEVLRKLGDECSLEEEIKFYGALSHGRPLPIPVHFPNGPGVGCHGETPSQRIPFHGGV